MSLKQIIENGKAVCLVVSFCIQPFYNVYGQTERIYPPNTKWYQDPFGLKPVQLSTAFGFVWGSAAVAACLIFSKIDTGYHKKFSIYYGAGMSLGYKPPYTNVIQNDIGILYEIRKWMAIGIEWNGFHFKDKIDNTLGVGISPLTKWYAFKNKKAAVFFQYGAGISISHKRFPFTGIGRYADTGRIGTRINFTSHYSLGSEFYLNKKISLQTSLRHFHLSNGNIYGIKRNPSYDSNGFFITLIYGLTKRQIIFDNH
jgi:hypothetical protein